MTEIRYNILLCKIDPGDESYCYNRVSDHMSCSVFYKRENCVGALALNKLFREECENQSPRQFYIVDAKSCVSFSTGLIISY